MNQWDDPTLGNDDDPIADAVRTYPLAPVPPGLTPAIMARVQRAAKPRFELQWIDLALGLFGASMMATAWLVWQWVRTMPDWAGGLIASLLASVDPLDLAFGAVGVLGGLLVIGMCFVIALVVLIPGPTIRLQSVVTRRA